MTLLERARDFIAAKAVKIACTAVPLAALTAVGIPANASIVGSPAVANAGPSLVFGAGTCNVNPGTGTCSDVVAAGTGGNPNANFVQLYSTLSTSANNSGSYFLTFIATGGANSGSFSTPQVLPVDYDFVITQPVAGSVAWSLLVRAIGTSTYSGTISGTDTVNGPSTITGATSVTVPAGQSITGYSIQLSLSSISANDHFTVSIPAGATIDVNPTATTPEPSTMLLAAGAGLAGLFIRRRKK